MEEVRVLSVVLLPSHSPPLPRSPHGGKLANRKQRPRTALTYGFCRLLEFWVPSLGNIRARQPPLLSTISETGQQQDWDGRGGEPRGKRKRLLLTIHSAGTGSKNNSTPPRRGASPPPRLGSHLLCCREERRSGRGETANRWETNRSPQAHLKEIFISSGGVVIPGAFQQNVNPSRAGTRKLYVDWSGTQDRAMGFYLECLPTTRTSCQRWEQFFEAQVKDVSETPCLKNLASGCFRGCCCLAVVSQLFEFPRTVTHQAPLCMGVFQARILEWVAISFSRRSRIQDGTRISCTGRQILYHWATWEALLQGYRLILIHSLPLTPIPVSTETRVPKFIRVLGCLCYSWPNTPSLLRRLGHFGDWQKL